MKLCPALNSRADLWQILYCSAHTHTDFYCKRTLYSYEKQLVELFQNSTHLLCPKCEKKYKSFNNNSKQLNIAVATLNASIMRNKV